jgi:hypothetical protein
MAPGTISAVENRGTGAVGTLTVLAAALGLNPVWVRTGAGPRELPRPDTLTAPELNLVEAVRSLSDPSQEVLYLLAGLVLAIVLGLGYNLAHAGRERLTAGVTAYGWLASPAAAGHPENRAKILEDLIAAELARRSPK